MASVVFNNGDFVELVTGSPVMVIESLTYYGSRANVLYYDNGIKRDEINVDFLRKIPKSKLLPPTRFERINKDNT
jgi:hypothetical protein